MKIALFSNILLMLLFIVSCSQEKSGTDKVTISGDNIFITKSDIENGIKKTTSTMSSVIMSHKKHEKAGLKCVTCHHKKGNKSRIKTCTYCHKGLNGTKLLHKYCIGCHEKDNKGPQVCNECHIEKDSYKISKEMKAKYSGKVIYNEKYHPVHENAGVKCIECHHSDGNIKDKKKIKKCSQCHLGKSRIKILHIFCKDCHKNKGKGPLNCNNCHK